MANPPAAAQTPVTSTSPLYISPMPYHVPKRAPFPVGDHRPVSDAFPPPGYEDPRDIRQLHFALQAGGSYIIRDSPRWVSAVAGGLEWGKAFAAEARTTMGASLTVGTRMSGAGGQTPELTAPWSVSIGPVTMNVSTSPRPVLSLSGRPPGILSYYPRGGPGVEFSHSYRFTSEGRFPNISWTLEYAPLDYRVSGGQELAGLPGYAGRAGVYVKVYPMRTILLGGVYVTAAMLAKELLAAWWLLGQLWPVLTR